jgi:tetratricopeptide (TPR) repeat protein
MIEFGDSDRAEAHCERGQTYCSLHQYADAWAEFNDAVELDPNLVWAIAGRGSANRMLAPYTVALNDFNRLIELIPEVADAFVFRGCAHSGLERYDQARADFHRALVLDPSCDLAKEECANLPKQMGALKPQTMKERAMEA